MAEKFIGSHGDDWCVRIGQLGPPDSVQAHVMRWLITPGPPLSCYLALQTSLADPKILTYYHKHPETWSLHVVLSGTGSHFVDQTENRIGPGSVIYQGPNVRHSIYPDPGQTLVHISVQTPSAGTREREWVVCPEAGTTDRFGDPAAFAERFGSVERLIGELAPMFVSERWSEFMGRKRQ